MTEAKGSLWGSWTLSWTLWLWFNLVLGLTALLFHVPWHMQYRPDRALSVCAGCYWSHCKLFWNMSSSVYCDVAQKISPETFEIRHLKLLGISDHHFSSVSLPCLLNQANTTLFRQQLKIKSIFLVKLWHTECFTRDIHNILATSIRKLIHV